jgi:hypothetical protein
MRHVIIYTAAFPAAADSEDLSEESAETAVGAAEPADEFEEMVSSATAKQQDATTHS